MWKHVGTRDGVRGWQQEGPGTVLMHRGHLQSGESPRAVPRGDPREGLVPSPSSCPVSDPKCSAGEKWREEKSSFGGEGKSKKKDLGLPSSTPSYPPPQPQFQQQNPNPMHSPRTSMASLQLQLKLSPG